MPAVTKFALLAGALVGAVHHVRLTSAQVSVLRDAMQTGHMSYAPITSDPITWALAVPTIASGIGYIVHIARHPELTKNQRMLWIALCLTVGPFAALAYWFRHVRNQHSGVQA